MARRLLHLLNLANVAYGYCRFQRDAGRDAVVRCHDLRHVMSQPEWEEVDLRAEDVVDENDFFASRPDLRGYRRPPWFQAEEVSPLGGFRPLPAPPSSRAARAARTMLAKLPGAIERLSPALWNRLRAARASMRERSLSGNGGGNGGAALRSSLLERCRVLARESATHGSAWALDEHELRRFVPLALWTARHARDRDLLFAYVYSPIYALLLDLPFVSVEIGTLREIPFDGTPMGRALAFAYRCSPLLLVTNPDVRAQAERLGISRFLFCPHPLDEERHVGQPEESTRQLRADLSRGCPEAVLLFAPARQNWALKGNDRILRGVAGLLRQGVAARLVVATWGQEIERSRALARDLGIEDAVSWLPPQSEVALRRIYASVDVVLDQFVLGVFGLITPKALASGAVVVTSYEPALNSWAFPEPPPVVNASSHEEITAALERLAADPAQRRRRSDEGRRWVSRWHSKRVITATLEQAEGLAAEAFASARTARGIPARGIPA